MRYLVLAIRKPTFTAEASVAHREFLDRLRVEQRLEMSGPFTDGTGGAYLLRADSLEEARGIAHGDPLHTFGASVVTVYEWHIV